MKAHYPGWGITKTLKETFAEIAEAFRRLALDKGVKSPVSGAVSRDPDGASQVARPFAPGDAWLCFR